jgi:hypothetical protein
MSTQDEHEKSFTGLDHCVYMRKATTECGVPVWALFDGDGDLVLFDEERNVIWFHIMLNDLTHRWLN